MAMPEPGYDTTSALVVTDVQNDFASPGGSLYVAGGEEVVRGAGRAAERAGDRGAAAARAPAAGVPAARLRPGARPGYPGAAGVSRALP